MNKNEYVSRGSLKTEKEIVYIDMDGVLYV